MAGTVIRGRIDMFGCSYRSAERRVKELYITPYDVQTQPMIFFNIRLAANVENVVHFPQIPQPVGRWIKEPLRERLTWVLVGGL